MTASYAEQYAATLDATVERVHAMPCTRAQFDVDHDEFYDGPCHHCDLLALLEGPQQP